MKKLFNLLVFAAVVWFAIVSVRPYWNRYMVQMDIEEAALYGTKSSEGEVRRFLLEKMQEKGRRIKDIFIVKDDRNTVYVRMSYTDEIRIAGRILAHLQFTVHATESG